MDDRLAEQLDEIRDLLKQQLANSTLALERQNDAIKRQAESVARARKGQRGLTIVVCIGLGIYLLSIIVPWAMIWLVGRGTR